MNYLFTGILIGVVLALMFIVFYLYKRFFKAEASPDKEIPRNVQFNDNLEHYQEQEERERIQINPMPGASPELNNLMAELNQTGNQLVADAVYDNVDTSILQTN
jgi:hypothetical protein